MENQDRKRLLIIDAALKRFAHYGLAKTTMTEIAKDIAFSKALLYYYFPDKLSLYVSVIEHLMHQISRDLVKSVEKTSSAAEGILMLVQKRQAFIQKYYKLIEYTKMMGPELPDELQDKFTRARAFELKIITGLLNKGNASGEFSVADLNFTTEIFVEAISGIHFNILNRSKIIYPDKEQFKLIFLKEKRFTEIFLAGLKQTNRS
ncbi:TetR/AcrR family transcriptional regulator [Pedobacter antarcticus]|uniref:Transcriptional regulator n=2 Tax=Pedobacter antarcticus TaxID=34086 RepID=A0A081PJJ4_9SPHI|nr:TetR/AcrR family transcriptional regulator [Pedobacter antarcticus]KEQ30867.1 transcriptional regulator [Pedobacter antarcticus 4BY]SDM54536.1 transcriptional regulator, TetR family [Pedobacter antarcticus]SFF44867.1 transcriptional regulator, TetR family [Pedobacter antarcticus]